MKNWITVVGLFAWAGVALAAPSPGQKCEAGKNQEAGKYAFCLHKAEAKLLKTKGVCSASGDIVCYGDVDCPVADTCTKDLAKYGAAVTKCEEKFAAKWTKLTQKALDQGDACPDGLADTDVRSVVDDSVANVAGALAGDGFSDCNGDLALCSGDLDACSADLGTCNANRVTCTADLGTCNTSLSACNGSLDTCSVDLQTAQSGNATAADVLGGKTFASAAGLSGTGTMPNRGAVNITPGTSAKSIGAGYHNGSGTVAGDGDLVAGNIRKDVDLFGVTGTFTGLCGNGSVDAGEDCDEGDLNGGSCAGEGFAGGTLRCGAGCSYDTSACYAARFVDNGDGTIRDEQTGLMWEKKSYDGGIHDWTWPYVWSSGSPYGPTGATFTTFLATLNGAFDGNCFAGHCDWRLPTVAELQSLLAGSDPCATHPCIDPAFNNNCTSGCDVTTCSCTGPGVYWTGVTDAATPWKAFHVDFYWGRTTSVNKLGDDLVRAVRNGS